MSEAGKGGLERRVAERIDIKLGVTWRHLDKDEADRLLTNGEYSELFSIDDLHSHTSEASLERQAYTENLSVTGVRLVGDLRLHTGEQLQEGWELMVSLDVPGSERPVRALAIVVWAVPGQAGKMSAGLYFKGVNKDDIERLARLTAEKKKLEGA